MGEKDSRRRHRHSPSQSASRDRGRRSRSRERHKSSKRHRRDKRSRSHSQSRRSSRRRRDSRSRSRDRSKRDGKRSDRSVDRNVGDKHEGSSSKSRPTESSYTRRSKERSLDRDAKRQRVDKETKAPDTSVEKSEANEKKTDLHFGGISLHQEDSNPEDQAKRRRREQLQKWKERQRQKQAEEAQKQFDAGNEEKMATMPHIWTPEEETEEQMKKREEDERAQKERMQQVVDEVDPLDAYMAGLTDQAAMQQATDSVISKDEIENGGRLNIYGSFLPPTDSSGDFVKEETKEEKEAREEKELKEFMQAFHEKSTAATEEVVPSIEEKPPVVKRETGRIYQGFEEDVIGEDADEIDDRSALEILQEAQKKKEIKPVDHAQIDYIPFQKKFYVEPKEIKDMSEEQVASLRKDLEIIVRGKSVPKPLTKWSQCGLSLRTLQLLRKFEYSEPFAIQCQALPAIMSGRDVIGVAKTGSGKTLAFLLPMFRHILAQPPLKEGEGPIALVMAPARELAKQIYSEARKFAKGLGMRAAAVYGGSPVSEQIANLKRGADLVVCTPGRMIDILTMSAGKLVDLARVTYVVLDEADRMFDMGFEPQITKILMNVRPDRQTLLFSATFPRSVEGLARKVLKKPVEITVGARSTASGDITQYVEVREEDDKFMRLLQLLGKWYEKGNVLVFVNTQQACDQIFQDLMRAGYPALSLHGGKDQVDRDYTIDDYKRKVRTLMVATSVAGRGLDVKDLVLVINYHCPNHLEDYVHRVGRTGRAGRKGTAYTFISPEEEAYSLELVKALESGKQSVPNELRQMADGFMARVKRGEAHAPGSGFRGKGYTFDESELNETQKAAQAERRQYEMDQGILVEEKEEKEEEENETETEKKDDKHLSTETMSAVKKAKQIAMMLAHQSHQATVSGNGNFFEEELEINDYPQQARWKVTQKDAAESVAELTGAAVIARGSHVPTKRKPNPGERKLYLAIEGPTRQSVVEAKAELQRILNETTLQVGLGGDKYGKYSV